MIDWHHHLSPPLFCQREPSPPIHSTFQRLGPRSNDVHDVEKHLAFMEAVGIDLAVLTSPMNDSLVDRRLINDTYAMIYADHPGRFVGFASCIPNAGEEELDELDRAITVLGLRGVMVTPQNGGEQLDSPALYPFYERVARLGVPIYVHTGKGIRGFDALNAPYRLDKILLNEFDVCNGALRVILGGVMARFPDLRFVFTHMGGVLPVVKEQAMNIVDALGDRFWTVAGGSPPLEKPYAESFDRFFGRLYFDFAAGDDEGAGMTGMSCALAAISPERLIFGADFPFVGQELARRLVASVAKLDLSAESKELMMWGNAAKLLGI